MRTDVFASRILASERNLQQHLEKVAFENPRQLIYSETIYDIRLKNPEARSSHYERFLESYSITFKEKNNVLSN